MPHAIFTIANGEKNTPRLFLSELEGGGAKKGDKK